MVNKKLSLSFLFIIALTAFWSPVSAEKTKEDLTDLSLESLMELSVYGASKFEQKVVEAPSSVSIVSSEEIRKYGYRTLADVLKSVRGFYVSYDRNYHYVGIRGFSRPGDYNTRVLLLIDGHRINDNIFNQAPVGTDFPLDPDLIERIEIIRGPGSSLYGDNAFFGVINVITRNDLSGGELSGAFSSHETYDGRLSFGRKFGESIYMMVSGSIMDSRGDSRLYFQEFDNPEENDGIAENGDYDRSYSFFTKLRYHDLTLEGIYNSRTKGVPTGVFEMAFNDPRNRTLDEHASLDLRYDHAFENRVAVMARIYYDYYKFRGDYVYSAVDKEIAISDALGGELLVSKQLFERHKVLAGFEIHQNIKLYQSYNESSFGNIFTDNRNSNQWAFYIQDEVHLLDNLIINGGLRYDRYSTFGGTVNPRLALLYKPLENSNLKLLYGEAFRAPSAYESFYAVGDVGGQKANPELKPEKIRTYELIYEQYIGKQFKASVSGFMSRIDNLITQTIDPEDNLIVFLNSDTVTAKGLEFELEGKSSDGMQGILSYTLSRTKDHESGNTLSNSPEHLAKLNIIIPLINNKVFLGLEEQYTSKRKTLAGSDTKGFGVTNVTVLGRNIVKGLEISGSVYNLFDARYSDPGIEDRRPDLIPQDGRNFRVKLTYVF